MPTNLGKIISERRLQLGKTLDDVGRDVGVSKSTVQRWESGNIQNMRRDKLVDLARALDTTPAYLMGLTDTPDSPMLNAYGIAATKRITKRTAFTSLLELAGYCETCDDDANVTISNKSIQINETPELVDRIMDDVIDFFTYKIEREKEK